MTHRPGRWSTLPVDAIGLGAALIAVAMLGTMCYYIRLFAAFRGCATTLERLHGQLDGTALVLGLAAAVGWVGYTMAQPRMTKIERWVVLCSLAGSVGTVLTWAMMKQIRF